MLNSVLKILNSNKFIFENKALYITLLHLQSCILASYICLIFNLMCPLMTLHVFFSDKIADDQSIHLFLDTSESDSEEDDEANISCYVVSMKLT